MTVASQRAQWLILVLLLPVAHTAVALEFPGPEPGTATAKLAGDVLILENPRERAMEHRRRAMRDR